MVEWKKLGEVCDILNGFAFKSQEYVSEGIRIIRISDVQSGCISDKDKVFYPVEKVSEFERYLLHQGDLVMSLTGNPGRIAIIKDDSCALNQRVACLRANDVSRSFLFYLFNCKEFESIAFANSTGGAQKNLSTAWLNNYRIPIPSLSEQQRIVSILDTFTSSISNLKQQIEERRKQYEYERDLLLDLEGKEGVEMKTLGEVANFVKDRIEASFLNSQNYVSVENLLKDKAGRIDSENVPFKGNWSCYKHGDVLIGNIRPYLRKIWLADRKGGTNGDVLIIRPNEFILPQFLYCVLASEKFFEYYNQTAKGGKMPRGEKSRALSYIIPLPPLSTQSRIVSILDTFEQSISNLEEQLAMREKQYEYYRNQLLTFEGEEERGKT